MGEGGRGVGREVNSSRTYRRYLLSIGFIQNGYSSEVFNVSRQQRLPPCHFPCSAASAQCHQRTFPVCSHYIGWRVAIVESSAREEEELAL